MEKQTSASKGIPTFLVGGAIGVGAGLLLSRACSTGQEAEGKTGDGRTAAGTYCAVPEVLTFVFPKT